MAQAASKQGMWRAPLDPLLGLQRPVGKQGFCKLLLSGTVQGKLVI
jgi:hypothetical protein